MTTRLILCVLLIIISPWLLAKELILLHTNDFSRAHSTRGQIRWRG